MFNLFKKRKKPSTPIETEVKPKQTKKFLDVGSSDSIVSCEMAKELINDVQGILIRYESCLHDLGKNQTEEEKVHIAWLNERLKELYEEQRNVKYGDDQIPRNNKIRKVYGALVRDYFALPEKTDKEVAEKGLPERFVTTKVDLSEFDDKGGEENVQPI